MTSAILIPWAQTDWQAAGRYACTTPVAINQQGEQQVEQWAAAVAAHDPVVIYGLGRNPSDQTARLIAEQLKTKTKAAAGLEEVSIGLWEGLTPDQMKKRFARTYRQWKEDPTSVCPPEGEELLAAGARLSSAFHKLTKKHEQGCFAVVLGPLALAALRCHLQGAGYERLWEMTANKPVKYVINVEQNKAVLST